MVLYEIVVLVDSQAPGQRVVDFLRRTARHVFSRSGNVRKVENWGERPLAYRMRRNRTKHASARYMSIWLDAHPVVLQEVEKLMRFNQDILRHTSFKRKLTLPEGEGFLSREIREAAQRAEAEYTGAK